MPAIWTSKCTVSVYQFAQGMEFIMRKNGNSKVIQYLDNYVTFEHGELACRKNL